jgi:hypothetical protein
MRTEEMAKKTDSDRSKSEQGENIGEQKMEIRKIRVDTKHKNKHITISICDIVYF